MTLVAVDGTPLVPMGAAGRGGVPLLTTASNTVLDAANEACIMIGHIITEDGGSHTIDTSGSSSLGWMSGALTFANAGTTVKCGLAVVDTTTGPPGRAANAANVITFDVSKSLTGGGGGITASAWQEHVPDTGTKTIANGDLIAFAVQMTAAGGADAVRPQTIVNIGAAPTIYPYVTDYVGGAYTNNGLLPNVVITFSDGKLGWFAGGVAFLTPTTTTTWNNTSGTKEYGNFFQPPFPAGVYGIYLAASIVGNMDIILYSDPLGTPVAEKTVSIDLNTVGAASNRNGLVWFPAPFNATINQPLAAIAKPTSATNNTMAYKTYNIAGHQKTEPFGTNGYAVSRNTGAFAAVNSGKDRYTIGLLVGAWDNGANTVLINSIENNYMLEYEAA